MARSRTVMLIAALFVLTWLSADLSFAQGQQGQTAQRPRMMCQNRLVSMDTNKDGQVDKTEFMAVSHPGPNPDAIFTSRDANGDGVLSRDEFCAGKGRRRGRMQ